MNEGAIAASRQRQIFNRVPQRPQAAALQLAAIGMNCPATFVVKFTDHVSSMPGPL
jgi:hypothetical protein